MTTKNAWTTWISEQKAFVDTKVPLEWQAREKEIVFVSMQQTPKNAQSAITKTKSPLRGYVITG